MPKGLTIDRIELHRYLWMQATRNGRVEIYQKSLAEKIGVTQATMSLIIKDLKESGRIRKISSKANNVGIYAVRDPAMFEHEFDPTEPTVAANVFRCGVCGEFEDHELHYPPQA
jgi:DNA-binding Lrp family transcriptional regulator